MHICCWCAVVVVDPEVVVDVWCETPVQRMWKEFTDSVLTKGDREMKWGRIEYWFVMSIQHHLKNASIQGCSMCLLLLCTLNCWWEWAHQV